MLSLVQPVKKINIDQLKLKSLSKSLPNYMMPKRLKVSSIKVSHRFKKN